MHSTRVKVMFIEVTNDDENFLKNQYKTAARTSPDYEGINDFDAVISIIISIIISIC